MKIVSYFTTLWAEGNKKFTPLDTIQNYLLDHTELVVFAWLSFFSCFCYRGAWIMEAQWYIRLTQHRPGSPDISALIPESLTLWR